MAKTSTRETLEDIIRESMGLGPDEDVHWTAYADDVDLGMRTLYRMRHRLMTPTRGSLAAIARDLADRGLAGGDLEAVKARVRAAVRPYRCPHTQRCVE